MVAKRKSTTYKVGRDAATGKFIPVKVAERRKKTAVVETVKKKSGGTRTVASKGKPIHTSKGVSGSAIIKKLRITKKNVIAAKKIVKRKSSRKSKTVRKR